MLRRIKLAWIAITNPCYFNHEINGNRTYKKGDQVKVWSLQSFHHGGFLNGSLAVVSQDQMKGGSVLITVDRNINGNYETDTSYEVYPEQLSIRYT